MDWGAEIKLCLLLRDLALLDAVTPLLALPSVSISIPAIPVTVHPYEWISLDVERKRDEGILDDGCEDSDRRIIRAWYFSIVGSTLKINRRASGRRANFVRGGLDQVNAVSSLIINAKLFLNVEVV